MLFLEINANDLTAVTELSKLASSILREYYDPLIGSEQNTYMIDKFQSVTGILDHMAKGATYFVLQVDGEDIGFVAYEIHEDALYLSKFYFSNKSRSRGYSRPVIQELDRIARSHQLPVCRLNVNKYNPSIKVYERLGFKIVKSEVNDIGQGYVMDDYVMERVIPKNDSIKE